MQFVPRPYQQKAIDAALSFFKSEEKGNGIIVLPTGAGKSICIANIAKGLDGPVLILQPNVEILTQNAQKYCSYGFRAGIYSASAGQKRIDHVTFATIGSIVKKIHLFKNVKYIIQDECESTSAKGGMYHDLFKGLPNARLVGLTATPYRLSATMEGAMLKFITRTNPRIYNKVLYYVQNSELFDAGYLSKLEYFSFDVVDRSMLRINSSGSDFAEDSLRHYYRQINMPQITIGYANRLLKKRKNLLVFCSLIVEAEEVCKGIPGAMLVTGETDKVLREKILRQFKAGIIKCVVNVGVLTCGFDHVELECVLLARSTMSLRLYYQIMGRAIRPHPNKESAWLVDLGGNIKFFGKLEELKIQVGPTGLFSVWNNKKQLTNVLFQKQ